MSVWHSCSWCHELVPIAEEFCPECGHQAHTPRMHCECARCVRWRITPRAAQLAELREGLPELLDWLKGKGHADLAAKLAAIREKEGA